MRDKSPTQNPPRGMSLRHSLVLPRNREMFCLAWSGDGRTLAYAGNETIATWDTEESLIRLWDLETKRGRGAIREPSLEVCSLAWSRQEPMLASGSNTGEVRLWDQSRQLRRTLKEHTGAVLGLAWSPNSQMLASGGQDGKVVLWNVQTRKVHKVLAGHRARVVR